MGLLVLAALALGLGWFLWTSFAPAYRAPPDLVLAKIRAGAKVLDVRTHLEFRGGSYPGAHNLPLGEMASRLGELGARDRPLVVFCASGHRSSRAASLLRRAGFSDVTNAGPLLTMPREPR